jgi:hypothetical protein
VTDFRDDPDADYRRRLVREAVAAERRRVLRLVDAATRVSANKVSAAVRNLLAALREDIDVGTQLLPMDAE